MAIPIAALLVVQDPFYNSRREQLVGLAGGLATGAVGVLVAITVTMYEIGSQYPDAIILTPSSQVIHRDISAIEVTGFIQPLEEAGRVRRVSVW